MIQRLFGRVAFLPTPIAFSQLKTNRKIRSLLSIVVVSIMLMGCEQDPPLAALTFEIYNAAQSTVKDANINLVHSTTVVTFSKEATIESGSKRIIRYNLRDNTKQITEGGYRISTELDNGSRLQKDFGYFTNSADSDPDHRYTIIISDGDIQIE